MAGVRLPVRTHPLHAFVTNDYAQGFPIILASTELACYVSQTERGQMLIGAEFDSQPSYSRQASFAALRSYSYKITRLLPFLQGMRILRQWAGICDISVDFSPIMSATPVARLLRHDRLGHVGLQGDPGRRRGHGRADRHGPAPGADRAVHAGPLRAATTCWPTPARRARGLMLWLDCPRCGRRPLDEFVFGGERRQTPSGDRGRGRARLRRGLDLRQPRRRDDRALVPRARLPALADRPPRHEPRRRPGGALTDVDVDAAGRPSARAARARSRPLRGRRDRGRSASSSRTSASGRSS